MTYRPVVLVTGAARGIGRKIALTFADDDYDVAVLDISFGGYKDFPDEQNNDVRDELVDRGSAVESVEASTTDIIAMTDLVSRVVRRLGRIDAVICNAGGGSGSLEGNRASAIEVASLTDVLQRNLYGTIATVTSTLPALSASSRPSIVTMSSLNGIEPTDNGRYAHYGIAKAAVAHYTRYLARDLRERGIRANCIAPGVIETGRLSARMQESPGANEALAKSLGSFGTASDVAELALYLASPTSRYINGQIIRIDGGI